MTASTPLVIVIAMLAALPTTFKVCETATLAKAKFPLPSVVKA
jgi:hypothetical protein